LQHLVFFTSIVAFLVPNSSSFCIYYTL
jgi:hypothetical protein